MSLKGMMEEPTLSPNARRTIETRYLLRGQDGQLLETPGELFRRVALFVASAESKYGASAERVEEVAQEYYTTMIRGLFLPNSPTLMNAGRSLGMLSACFVLPIDDSVDGIFESVKQTAKIQKAGGGTGFSFDRLRPTGDYISSSGGQTSGPISFWRVFSEATRAIQQGAFRRGANMGMMSIEHPDILKFITAKSHLREFENFNISIKIPDSFIDALRQDPNAAHQVVNPRNGRRYFLPFRIDLRNYRLADLIDADSGANAKAVFTRQAVWDLIVQNAHATGEPGVCYIDRVNAANPTPLLGRIEATNPCGEQPLLDHEACNLGSIDLSKLCRGGTLDEATFRQRIRMGIRFLDNVIEVNKYGLPEIEKQCLGNRKIGLGIMGFADALFEMGIKYDSDDGLNMGSFIAKILSEESAAASEELASERGNFPNWPGSLWDTRHHRPMRNATLTTIAPTGTLSILAGCSGGIEPAFALAFYRNILEGQEMLEVNGPFKRYASEHGFWSVDLELRLAAGTSLKHLPDVDRRAADLFVTAHDVPPKMHVKMQAAFQQYIDGAISKTINLPQSASVGDVEEVYFLAYDLGCKGVTVYRDKSRQGQPMVQLTAQRVTGLCPRCRTELEDEGGCTRCPSCGTVLCP